MKNLRKNFSRLALLVVSVLWMFCMTVSADDYDSSNDNYLLNLGLQNASDCTPGFDYSVLEYNVTVPAGTKTLELSPVTSAPNANIIDISGTELDDKGNGTVDIVVESESGIQLTYVLHVTAEGAAESTAETETQMDAQAAAESEAIAESERIAAESEAQAQKQKAAELEAKAAQVDLLKQENDDFAQRIDMLMKILYGLIAFAVILLFLIINQSLRNKDLKDEVKNLKNGHVDSYDFARKDDNVRNDFYYTPVQPAAQPNGSGPMNEVSGNVQEAFGNAPQVLHAQPMDPSMQVNGDMGAETQVSKKELRKQQKAAKRSAKKTKEQPQPIQNQQPVQYQQPVPQEPQMVQSTVDEPDVNVDMIDL